MARIRTVKPEFWEDEKIASLCRDARLLFIGLWNFADDEGRMRANPKYVKSKVFPYDDDVEVAELLCAIASLHLILRYTVDGQDYLWIVNFKKHQKIDRPQPSQLPAPPFNGPDPCPIEPSTNIQTAIVESSSSVRRTFAVGMEWNGMDKDMDRDKEGKKAIRCADASRGSRLADPFDAPSDWLEFAKRERPQFDPEVEAQKFADYWHGVPGAKGRKTDWPGTWRNFVRSDFYGKGQEQRKPPGGHTLQSMKDEIGQQLREQGIF